MNKITHGLVAVAAILVLTVGAAQRKTEPVKKQQNTYTTEQVVDLANAYKELEDKYKEAVSSRNQCELFIWKHGGDDSQVYFYSNRGNPEAWDRFTKS